MIAALRRCNRVSVALLMHYRSAATAWFSAVLGRYRRVGALLHFDSARTAKDLLLHTRESGLRSAGRMCEVGPPASGRSFFTVPYSRRGRSTGILPCGTSGCRRVLGTP